VEPFQNLHETTGGWMKPTGRVNRIQLATVISSSSFPAWNLQQGVGVKGSYQKARVCLLRSSKD
jgi:hypothetical protein